jgi:hypothetical protein
MFHVPQAVLDWLTEEDAPSIAYRTLVSIQGLEPEDSLVRSMAERIPESRDVRRA